MLTADIRLLSALGGRRTALMGGTALTAAVWISLGQTAAAQPAPNARPQGGQVVAGTASIGTSATTTTIDQTSNRAAVDWTSFDVGSGQSVDFVQPNAQSVTLNRVTGPDPSAIAGRIEANGKIIITNPSGVVFSGGSQVNAQSIVVSTAGISTQNFMAGRQVFDQPGNAGAQVSNQGTITVAQAGLAALVAPSVANSGLISAKLGHVVLAGAQTVTLDMYGDGLVSIDVTGQVTQAPVGPGGQAVTALVTNSGTILADGGTVALTAAAADGLIQTLVNAGGVVQADTAGGQTGQVAITGAGGAVIVQGGVAAEGLGAGQRGGQVQIAGSGATTIAAGAVVSASGVAGGGLVAVGTTLARAAGSGPAPAGTSAVVNVAAGARIAADATARGAGGRITVLSTRDTSIAGALSARGGVGGGDGGTIEMSGILGFALSGSADTSAPRGALGSVVLDPTDLTIVPNGQTSNIMPCGTCDPAIGYGQAPDEAAVTEAQIEALTGNIRLQAVNGLTVASNLTLGTQNLTLEAGNTLTVDAGVTVTANGLITLSAAAGDIPGYNPAGALDIAGTVVSTGLGVALNAGSGGIAIGGVVNTGAGALQIATTGALTEAAGGAVSAAQVDGVAGSVALAAAAGANTIATLGSFSTAGGFTLVNAGALSVTGPVSDQLGTIALTAPSIALAGNLTAVGVSLNSSGGIVQSGGLITAGTLAGSADTATLGQPNAIGVLGDFSIGRGLYLHDAEALVVQGAVTASGAFGYVYISASANLTILGGVAANYHVNLQAGANLGTGGTAAAALEVTGSVAIPGASAEGGILLGAGTGGILVSGLVDAAGGNLLAATGGALAEQGQGAIDAANLTGTVGSARLLAAANQIAGIGSLNSAFAGNGLIASGGNVTLTDGVPLTVGGGGNRDGIVVPTGGTIALTLDGLYLATTGAGARLAAPGGVVSIGPLTPGAPIALSATGAAGAGTLSIGGGGLQAIDAGTLQLGQLSGGAPDAGPITLAADGTTVDLGAGGLGTLELTSSGAVTQDGALTIAAVSGQAARLVLTNPANLVTTLAGFVTSAGDLSLSDAAMLNVTGAVTADGGAGNVALSAQQGMHLDGGIRGANVSLASAGDIRQGGSGGITAGTLSGTGARVTLGGGNAIGTLGSFCASAFSLTDGGALSVAGALSAPAVSLSVAGSLVLAGGITAADSLNLNAGGGIVQTGGAIVAGTLSGSGAGVVLQGGANGIGTLAGWTSGGDFALTDAAPLTLAGAVSAASGGTLTIAADAVDFAGGGLLSAPGGTVALVEASPGAGVVVSGGAGQFGAGLVSAGTLQIGAAGGGAVELAGTFDFAGAGVVDLQSAGAVGEGGSGGFTAGTLTGSAGSLVLGASSGVATEVAAVQGFSTTGGFTLANAGALTVGGLSAGGGVSLSSQGPLTLAGVVSGGTVALTAFGYRNGYGSITQTGGVLIAGVLTGSAAAGASFGAAGNAVAALGPFTSVGGFTLVDAGALAVVGKVSDGTGVALTAGGAITLAGVVSTPDLGLSAGGGIVQTGGSLSVGTLSGVAGGAVGLGAGNSIAILGQFSSLGGFTLVDTGALTVAGPVIDGAAGGTVELSAAGMTLAGTIAAAGVSLSSPAGSIVQTAGVITAGTLSGAAYYAGLGQGNAVAVLGGFSAVSGLRMVDAQALLVQGTVTGNDVSLQSGAGDLTVAGLVQAGAVTLQAPGGFLAEQGGGSIVADTLAGTAGGVSLQSPGNRIGGIGTGEDAGFAATAGNFMLVDGAGLTVGAAGNGAGIGVPAGGTIGLTIVDLNLAQGQAGGGARLAAPGGVVVIAPLSAGAPLAVVAGGTGVDGAVSVTGLGSGAIEAGALQIGALDAGAVTLAADGAGLDFGAGVGSLVVESGGAVGQVGPVTVASLSGQAAGVTLINAGNSIGTLAGLVTSAGDLSLASAGALTVGGTVVADGGLGTVWLAAPALDLDAAVTGAGVALNAAGGTIVQSGGAIAAGTLTGTAAYALLGGAGNAVARLGGFTVTGASGLDGVGLLVTSDEAMVVQGPVSAGGGGVTLAAAQMTVAGAIVSTGAVDLRAGGDVTVAPGVLVSGSGIELGAGDGGSAGYTAASMLEVSGTVRIGVAGGGTIGLDAGAGGVLIGGLIDAAGGVVRVTTAGALGEQAGGALYAGSLYGQAGSILLLSRGNEIGRLGAAPVVSVTGGVTSMTYRALSAMTGDVALVDSVGLSIGQTGTLASLSAPSGATISLSADGVALLGNAAGTPAILAAGGTIAIAPFTAGLPVAVMAGNVALAGSLSVTGVGDGALAAQVLAVGAPSAGAVVLAADGAGLNFGGVGTLVVESGGAVTQGGTVSVASLAGQAARLELADAGNAIGTLAGFVASAGDLSVATAGALSVAGAISAAGTVSLAAGGDLTVDPGVLLVSGGGIGLGAGDALDVDGTVRSLGGVGLQAGGGGVLIGGLIDAGGGLVLADTVGALAELGGVGVVQAGTLAGGAGSVSLGGANLIGTLGGFASQGGFTLSDGGTLTQTGALSASLVSLAVAGTLALDGTVTAGAVGLSGAGVAFDGSVVAGGLVLAESGGAVQGGGVLSVGTLSGVAGTVALGGAGTLSLASLGGLTASGTIGLNDAAGLRIDGDLSAPGVSVTSVGLLALDGGTLSVGGAAGMGGVLSVLPGAAGAGQFSQTGTSLVQGLGAGAAVLTIAAPGGGSVRLADVQAPAVTLVLALGQGGRAAGALEVGGLTVQGSSGAASLTGSVAGLSGFAAAGAAAITPAVARDYTLNGCEIGAAGCGVGAVSFAVLQQVAPALSSPEVAAGQAEDCWCTPVAADEACGCGAAGLVRTRGVAPMGGHCGAGGYSRLW
jgi:filamentous hemagglutinin family protein